MCNHTKDPVVTLQTAVLMQVNEFANLGSVFSVHDITRVIRNKANQGELEIPEVEVSGTSFRFDIPHTRVKSIFLDLLNTGVFDPNFKLNRNFNGTYFEYTPSLNSSVTPTPTPNVQVVTPSTPKKPDDTTIKLRIQLYLENCVKRQFQPTLKNVQSAIKRGNVSTGWTCDKLRDIIENDLGYTVVFDPEYESASQVVTI